MVLVTASPLVAPIHESDQITGNQLTNQNSDYFELENVWTHRKEKPCPEQLEYGLIETHQSEYSKRVI